MKALIKVLGITVFIMVLMAILSNFVVFNLTASMPLGIYLISEEKPQVGDVVIFETRSIVTTTSGRVAIDLSYTRLIKELASEDGYVVGHHPRSFDSRYFGKVDVKELKKATLWLEFRRTL